MEQQKITLNHQAELEPKLRELANRLSEYCFANIYLFRDVHSYELLSNKEPFIVGKSYDGKRYMMPVSLNGLKELANLSALPPGIDFIFPIGEEHAPFFDQSRWQSYYKEEDSDYLFDVNQIATYRGRHLSKKRNLVKQFLELYQVEIAPMTQNNKQAALQVLGKWKHKTSEDIKECQEAIELFETLKLVGMLYFVESQPVGFIIGEAISPETFVIHFAKADLQYKGIYQFMYQSFAQMFVGIFSFLNMEQDLGQPELRQAKHSYQPVQICPKFRFYL